MITPGNERSKTLTGRYSKRNKIINNFVKIIIIYFLKGVILLRGLIFFIGGLIFSIGGLIFSFGGLIFLGESGLILL